MFLIHRGCNPLTLFRFGIVQVAYSVRDAGGAPDAARGGCGTTNVGVPPQPRPSHLAALVGAGDGGDKRAVQRRCPVPSPADPRRPMGRRARVHPAVGGAPGLRHEKVHLLDPQAQVRGAALHQVRGELHRRWDERQRGQRGRGGGQGSERSREGRPVQGGVQQLVPAVDPSSAHRPPPVQGLESEQRQGSVLQGGAPVGGEVSARGQEEHRSGSPGHLREKRSADTADNQGDFVRVVRQLLPGQSYRLQGERTSILIFSLSV